jgi:AcrR family transcriptional regulator
MAEIDSHASGTRAEILRAAHGLFSHYGFAKTNVSEIADACGMSPANLYRYFRNKQAIGLAVVERHFRDSEAAMEAVLAAGAMRAEARIRGLVHAGVGHLVREMQQNPRLIELAEFLCSNEEGLTLLAGHIGWRRRRIAAELARGMAAAEIRAAEPEALAESLDLATKAFWMPFALARWRDISTVPGELDAVLDLVFEGLRPR